MSVELRVSFVISGFDGAPEAIDAALGLRPGKLWHVGEVIPGTTLRRKQNAWLLESPLEDHMNLNNHVAWLLERLPKSLEPLRAITSTWNAKLFCAVYTTGERPALGVTGDAVRRLADLGAAIDVDLYVMPPDD